MSAVMIGHLAEGSVCLHNQVRSDREFLDGRNRLVSKVTNIAWFNSAMGKIAVQDKLHIHIGISVNMALISVGGTWFYTSKSRYFILYVSVIF